MERQEKRGHFDSEFKENAVKLVLDSGKNLSSIANDLGVNESNLRRWKKQYLEDQQHAFPGKGYLKPQDEEIRRLKRELAVVKMERDILKKAIAIFSEKSPK